MNVELVRLQKFLSMCSVASRRKSEELILSGKVRINGKVAILGDKVRLNKDVVTVNGKKIVYSDKEKIYLALYKPRGFVSTLSDNLDRKCVASLVSDVGSKVYPVGRLDKDSEGLLLMTNDGDFANCISHPSRHIPKTYRVTIKPEINEEQLYEFRNGVLIDGRKTLPADVRVLEKYDNRTVLEVVLYEGRNREIRKICDSFGIDVLRLKRTAIGSLKLGMLPQGKWRFLSEAEVHKLMVSCGMKNPK